MKRPLRPLVAGALVAALSAVAIPALAQTPVINAVTPVSTTVNVPTNFSAVVSAAGGIQSCNLYVDLVDVGDMGLSGGLASKAYTFTSGGSHIAFVFCRDTQGKANSGPNTAIWVEGAVADTPAFTGSTMGNDMTLSQGQSPFNTPSTTPPPTPSPQTTTPTPAATSSSETPAPQTSVTSDAGRLIKLACADGAPVEDPCHAVYFQGVDGKRHAFPNSKVFFTWYADFSTVVELDISAMSVIPLGKNVPYRPGTRMVKFQSVPNVYAVGKGGVLRWVTSEDVAKAIYGDAWNTRIDDIDEAFYTDYSFGTDIKSKTDYDTAVEQGLTTNINQGL